MSHSDGIFQLQFQIGTPYNAWYSIVASFDSV